VSVEVVQSGGSRFATAAEHTSSCSAAQVPCSKQVAASTRPGQGGNRGEYSGTKGGVPD
jgi:hypothetical protein